MSRRPCDERPMVVPAVNSAANILMRDVIGNKLDTSVGGDSLYARMMSLWNFFNLEREVWPDLAAGVTVTSAGADWTFGAYATVVAAAAIVNPFHIHNITIETCDVNGVFQLELYHGAGDTLATAIRFSQLGGFFGNSVYFTGSAIIAGGERIRARIASSDGLANPVTITMSIGYIEHVP